MSLRRRLAVSAILLACAAAAPAQTYPSRPIEFIVHTSPGSGTDVFARGVTEIMSRDKLLPQPVNVVNRTGGGGTIAFNYIKGKRSDPHVVLTIATGSLLTATVQADLGLGLDNYTPLAFFAQDPQGIIVNADSRYATAKDLLDHAKKEPDALVAAVTSFGGTARQLLYMLEKETGARFKPVSFKGGGDAVLAVLGGHVPLTTENVSEAWGHIEAKKMKVLAVTTEQRLPALPGVPTLKELGIPIVIGTGRGFAMPAGVPKEAAARMEGALKRVHDSAAWKEVAAKNMYEDRYLASPEFARYLVVRRAEMQEFLQASGLSQKP